MYEERAKHNQFEHFTRRGTQVEVSEPLLKLLVVLEQLEYLEDP